MGIKYVVSAKIGGDMKKSSYSFCFVISIIAFSLISGCASPEKQPEKVSSESTCVQGTVWHRPPDKAQPVVYPHVNIYVWSHGKNEPLTETKADKQGRFCVDVPRGEYTVDLRAIGLMDAAGERYKCRGSADDISLGNEVKTCGEECVKADIMTECEIFYPRRRNR